MLRQTLALALFAPSVLVAQSERERGYLFKEPPVTLTLHGGFGMPTSTGDLWAFTFDELTLGRRDLMAFDQGVDLALRLNDRFDLVIGYLASSTRQNSELRDWVDENDQPIRQRTSFTRRPLSASVRYSLKPKGSMIGSYAWVPATTVPFIGLGAGRMSYKFQQAGEFVDESTQEIFEDSYSAAGKVGFVVASAGAGFTIAPSLVLTTEFRYLHAGSDGRPSYLGFERLDLSGLSTLVGFTLRFN
jgi:hypothetical protein